MKILVLGSEGQIGSGLTEYLKNHNHNIVEFDIFSNKDNDLRVPNILDSILPDIDFVFFLAFDVGGSIYLKAYQDTYEFISNNVKIMNNTFDSLKKFNVPFIFTSSQMSNMTYSSYGVLKKIGEKYTESIEKGKIATLWNVYGYEKDLNKSHVITDFILMAKEGIIRLRTNGVETREFLYVEDCCDCLNAIMENFEDINLKQIDITSFKSISIKEIATIIANKFNCLFVCSDKEDDVQLDKNNKASNYILNFWQPKTSIEDGISELIKKY